jgi:hypothetical protein
MIVIYLKISKSLFFMSATFEFRENHLNFSRNKKFILKFKNIMIHFLKNSHSDNSIRPSKNVINQINYSSCNSKRVAPL